MEMRRTRRIRRKLPINFFQELEQNLKSISSIQNVCVIENSTTPSYFEFANDNPAWSGVPVRLRVETQDESKFGGIKLSLYANTERYTDIFFEGVKILIESDIKISEVSLEHTCGYREYFEEKLAQFSYLNQ
ncbi:hypothetical protein [Bacillus thuringiensis]|uniref:hypothetical protein n=1 Tax=Bacillus thuringiensis TaxID=1428 RepID=UPI0021D6972A|nr:hypothetical protein [Bacillus thuringiensis]MCU7667897.1 hypothetical protein [Bacillus thuringiensis]